MKNQFFSFRRLLTAFAVSICSFFASSAFGVCGVPQDLVNAAVAGSTLDMTGCVSSGSLRISKPLRLIGLTLNSPAGVSAITITADDVILERLTLRGPQALSYDANAIGISAAGTSLKPVRRLQILDSKISRYGSIAMNLNYIYDAQILRNTVEDAVYAGIMVLSAQGGHVKNNTVRRIGVYGASTNYNNAYGIAISQQSPPTDPQSRDVVVDSNVVEDVPTWHGLDTHAGIRIKFTNNIVRRCQDGIYITGDDSYRRALDVTIENNRVEAPTNADQYGVTSVYSTGGAIRNNNIIGYPSGHSILTTSDGDDQATAQNLVVSGNYNNPLAPLPSPAPAPAPAPTPSPTTSTPTVSLNASTVAPGAVITVQVNGAGTSTENWIALYIASNPDSSLGYQENWQYLNGLRTEPAAPLTSATLKVTAPQEPGVYNVRLFATNDTTQRLAISSTITVVQPAIDQTAPKTAVTSPINGSYVRTQTDVVIQASASDNVSVTKVEFLVNGNLKCTSSTAPYRCSWRVPKGKGKIYNLKTRATDAAGNTSLSPVNKVTSY